MPSGHRLARRAGGFPLGSVSVIVFCQMIIPCFMTYAAAQDYEVPQPLIEAFYPKGLKVTIPDADGVQLFAFHGNVNRPLSYSLDAGELSADVTRRTNGAWTYHNKQRRLSVGDTLYFWLYVQKDGRGYRLDDQTYQISELIDSTSAIGVGNTYERPSGNGNLNYGGEAGTAEHRPVVSRPPSSGSLEYRPPAVQSQHEYPPPPPVTGTSHNHHVSLVGSNQGGSVNRPVYGENVEGRPTAGGSRPTYNENVESRPTAGGSRPTYNENVESRPTAGGSRPTLSGTRPTFGGAAGRPTTVDVDRPTFSGGDRPSGASGSSGPTLGLPVGLPLDADRFTAAPSLTGTSLDRDCELSVTTVNGRQACKGQVVFEENWRTLDPRRWGFEVKISGRPDFEFCVYAQHPENTYINNGRLHLKPTLTNDKYGTDFIRNGKLTLDDCTAGPVNSDTCTREAMFSYILPPILASRLTTKDSFRFKYGKIEVRAKLPRGDWIYPELWLQPHREEYGPGLASGRVHLAMARGNRNLRGPGPDAEDLGGQLLIAGLLAADKGVGSGLARRKFFSRRSDWGYWADDFHNYTLLWTPETLAFSVDGIELGAARPSEFGGLLHGQENEDDPWSRGTRMAPFDKEFYISLGTAVGGIHAFPDGCKSNNIEKPWKNTAAKAMLSFWNAKNHWYPTWSKDSEMSVESVRVEALNN